MAAPSIWRPLLVRSSPPGVKLCLGYSCLTARRAFPAIAQSHLVRALSSQPPPHEPLHILFCGSDAFSCASLQALHDEMQRQRTRAPVAEAPGRIATLDVVVRPAKRTGRGRATIIESPVKVLATQLGLPVYERDTFTGWTPPPPAGDTGKVINMIVAVSFGLFVPRRLLRAARFGGLNVHPSLLPDLHGAAPIEHAVLLGRLRTGVTVQTLDETTFDGGRRLLQGPRADATAQVGLSLPPRCTSADLHTLLAPQGADLLLEVLRRGLYLPEHVNVNVPASSLEGVAAAPKLTKADRQVSWRGQTAADIDRRSRALGELWTRLVPSGADKKRKRGDQDSGEAAGGPPTSKRVILGNLDLVTIPDSVQALLTARGSATSAEPATDWQTATFVHEDGEARQRIGLPFVADGEGIIVPVGVDVQDSSGLQCLRIGTMRVEGEKTRPAARAMSAFAGQDNVAAASDIAWEVVLKK
ncbi:Methionyl-tRNA formyltransferase [Sporothrix epigloea]|uniref:methionyl-tRNA formyltransferase n=1 Tax=Sporothrix epigloea TaxID=1892477 RepID=A0ABP0DHZ3_9PEZI